MYPPGEPERRRQRGRGSRGAGTVGQQPGPEATLLLSSDPSATVNLDYWRNTLTT